MASEGMFIQDIQNILLEGMTADVPHEGSIVIPISNDDVDKYLELLDRYENQPGNNLVRLK